MLPPAPGRLSTTTCWPKFLVSSCATSRATMSVEPPGAKPTSMRIVLVGKFCAPAAAASNNVKQNAVMMRMRSSVITQSCAAYRIARALRHADGFGEFFDHLARPRPHQRFKFGANLAVRRVVEAVLHFRRIVDEIIEFACARAELERAFVGLRAHGAQLQTDAAARRMHVPFAPRGIARIRTALEKGLQRAALQFMWRTDPSIIVERRGEVERRDRVADHLIWFNAGTA